MSLPEQKQKFISDFSFALLSRYMLVAFLLRVLSHFRKSSVLFYKSTGAETEICIYILYRNIYIYIIYSSRKIIRKSEIFVNIYMVGLKS